MPSITTTPTVEQDLALAADLVRTAGDMALSMRDRGLSVRQKTSRSDVVTAADESAELLVSTRLRGTRPDDGIVGEEGAQQVSRSGRTWVVDPVDGTYNFASGLGHWCSALALRDDEGTVLGAVYQPQTGELWVGGRSLPTTLGGEPLPPLEDAPLAELCAATYLHPTWFADDGVRGAWQRAASRAATIRMLGSGSVDLASVASGRIGVWFQHSCPEWDWLPGQALVEAAGGTTQVVPAGGVDWFVAGRPTAVAEVAALLRG